MVHTLFLPVNLFTKDILLALTFYIDTLLQRLLLRRLIFS